MSNLVDHAKRELELIGEEPETIEQYLKIIQAFADCGHSGFSAAHMTGVLHELLQYNNLSLLTDDPDEWMHVAEVTYGKPGGVWQNIRNSKAFSNDGGKTYYLLSEGGSDANRVPLRRSVKKKG
jgi:hypothetical protein